MKQFLSLVAFAVFISSHMLGQRTEVEFEDGTIMEYEVLANSGDAISPVFLSIGATHSNVREGLKIDYFNPSFGAITLRLPSFLATSQGVSYHLSGLYFLTDEAKSQTRPITLMSTSSGDVITKYRTESPVERKSRLGIHAGYGARNTASGSFSDGNIDISYSEVSIGLGLFRSQHLSIMREVDGVAYRAQGSATMMLTADVKFYTGTEPNTVYEGMEPLDPSSVGYEVAWVGRSSFWGKRPWGIWLTAGYGAGPLGGNPVAGGGLYFGFGGGK